jgi:predicted dehydrogenase
VPGKAEALAQHFNIPSAYKSAKEMLKKEKPDLVSVCTPNFNHKELTFLALKHDCHVICEKPIGMNAREAVQMVRAAKKAKKILSVGHHMRFSPEALALQKMITGGALGDVYFVRCMGIRRRGIPTWGLFFPKKYSGGGALIDIGVHYLDLLLWVVGRPDPVSVSAHSDCYLARQRNLVNPWGKVKVRSFDVDDFVSGFIRFDNGMTMLLEVAWAANVPATNQTHEILGTKGGASLNPLVISSQMDGMLVDTTPSGLPRVEHSHAPLIANVVRAIKGEEELIVHGEDSIRVMRIIDAIYKSSEEGREVKIPRK